MTRSPASPLDVVRKHYRRMAGTLTFGKTAGADPAAVRSNKDLNDAPRRKEETPRGPGGGVSLYY
jgi:hypothetical protein